MNKILIACFFVLIILATIFVAGCQKSNPSDICAPNGGTWLAEFNECEYMSEESCQSFGGVFVECESACRHDPNAEICTMQCVPVCYLS